MSFVVSDEVVKSAAGRWRSESAAIGLIFVVPALAAYTARNIQFRAYLRYTFSVFSPDHLISIGILVGIAIIAAVLVGSFSRIVGRKIIRTTIDGYPLLLLGRMAEASSRRFGRRRIRIREELDAMSEKWDRGGLSNADYSELMDLRSLGLGLSDRGAELLASRPARRSFISRRHYSRLTRALRRIPSSEELVQPTLAGNIVSSVEERLTRLTGLSLAACWPLLWMILSKDDREELGKAGQRLDDYSGIIVLIPALGPIAWASTESLGIGVMVFFGTMVVAFAACRRLSISSLSIFLDLVFASFLLHRAQLVALSPPIAPTEIEAAARLSRAQP